MKFIRFSVALYEHEHSVAGRWPGADTGNLANRQLQALTVFQPVSRIFLDYYLRGEMTTAEFLRWFHMPNSDYPDVARCIVPVVAGQ